MRQWAPPSQNSHLYRAVQVGPQCVSAALLKSSEKHDFPFSSFCLSARLPFPHTSGLSYLPAIELLSRHPAVLHAGLTSKSMVLLFLSFPLSPSAAETHNLSFCLSLFLNYFLNETKRTPPPEETPVCPISTDLFICSSSQCRHMGGEGPFLCVFLMHVINLHRGWLAEPMLLGSGI